MLSRFYVVTRLIVYIYIYISSNEDIKCTETRINDGGNGYHRISLTKTIALIMIYIYICIFRNILSRYKIIEFQRGREGRPHRGGVIFLQI